MHYIDTHTHLDGEEFAADRHEVVARANAAGVSRVLVPAINLQSVSTVLDTCRAFPGYAYPMIGLHPEDVKDDWRDVLSAMHDMLYSQLGNNDVPITDRFIAIGEVGLDYYWSRDYAQEQLEAFEEQVRWSVETRLPLMIHCRKAQNEMLSIMRKYKGNLPGGVFHCFTGNAIEARQLLEYDNFVLGIGGVITFKKSHLPEVVADIPLDRIVLETDSPYMAPVPMRGKRNESAFVRHVLERIALCKGVAPEAVADATNANVERLFGIKA